MSKGKGDQERKIENTGIFLLIFVLDEGGCYNIKDGSQEDLLEQVTLEQMT